MQAYRQTIAEIYGKEPRELVDGKVLGLTLSREINALKSFANGNLK